MPYESQTREQILEAEVELLRFRLNELLGEGLLCPIKALRGAKFRILNLMAKRSPQTVPWDALFQAMTNEPHELNAPYNTLRVHISRCRMVLKRRDIEIETVWGLGFRMSPESADKWQALVQAANGRAAA
jgi:DNA-binding response OmpR family regulator